MPVPDTRTHPQAVSHAFALYLSWLRHSVLGIYTYIHMEFLLSLPRFSPSVASLINKDVRLKQHNVCCKVA